MSHKKYIIFIIYTFSSLLLYAESEGLERHFRAYTLNGYQENYLGFHNDSSIDGVYRYLPQYSLSNHFYGYKNPGSPLRSMIFSKQSENHEFFFLNNYLPYITNNSDIIYFDARKPFTSFHFAGGAGGQEIVRFFHTQNINPYFNFGFDVNAINCEGIYMNNETKVNSISVFSGYTKKRYQSHTNLVFNKLSHLENGGIASDSVFRYTDIRHENIDVNLRNAQNSVSHIGVQYNHEYRLGSFSLDTIKQNGDTILNYIYDGRMSVIQDISANRYYRIYSDVPSEFYNNIYHDSLNTFDSTSLRNFKHEIFLNYNILKSDTSETKLKLMGGIKNNLFNYAIFDDNTKTYQYHYLSSHLMFRNKRHYLRASFDYGLAGIAMFDTKFRIRHNYKLSKNLQLNSYFNYLFEEPDILLNYYKSNHFKWENDFGKTHKLGGGTSIFLNKYNISIGTNINMISNYIIFNKLAKPEQISSPNLISDIYISNILNFGNFNWYNKVSYQYISDKENLPLPDLTAYSSLYYKNNLFDNAAILKTGLYFNYHSKNYSYAYMPATSVFYIQDKLETGNYFMLGYHLSLQVKRLRGFVNISNINTTFMDRNYYSMYMVPDNPFGVNFGVTWEFYN